MQEITQVSETQKEMESTRNVTGVSWRNAKKVKKFNSKFEDTTMNLPKTY